MTNDLHLFTSIRVEAGQCFLLPIHLDHMAASAETLSFALDRPALEATLVKLAADHGNRPAVKLRVLLAKDGAWTLEAPEPLLRDAAGMQVLLWPEPVNSQDPLLPHKIVRRPVYDRVVRQVHGCGYIDAIFHNEHGFVTEGGVHSVFARWGREWKTPTVGAGVLPGVYREHLLATTEAREADFTEDDLLRADEVWLTSALHGIRKVTVGRH